MRILVAGDSPSAKALRGYLARHDFHLTEYSSCRSQQRSRLGIIATRFSVSDRRRYAACCDVGRWSE